MSVSVLKVLKTERPKKIALSTGKIKPCLWRFYLTCCCLSLLLLGLTLLSLLYGSADLSSEQVLNALLKSSLGSTEHNVIWNLRLPRTLLAIIIGLHFALSGLILQSVIRNPLADPSVMGVSGGASLAIVAFLLLADVFTGALYAGEITHVSLAWLPLVALIGGITVAALVLRLAWVQALVPLN